MREAIASGVQQVLVLGAGFDTLCLGLAPQNRDVKFFEVDHPETSEEKTKGIAALGQPENLIQIPADFNERTLSEMLAEDSPWDPLKISVAVAEGLLQYLKGFYFDREKAFGLK